MKTVGKLYIVGCFFVVINSVHASMPTLSTVMTQGGDERVYLLPKTGLNKYQTLPCAMPHVISRASCTSSFPSEKGLEAAQNILATVLNAEDDDKAFEDAMDDLHIAIRTVVIRKLAVQNSYVITTASASDAELLVTTCALLRGQILKKEGFCGTVCSIMVSGGEISDRAIVEAGLRHGGGCAPCGDRVEKNTLLKGACDESCSTEVLLARGGVSGESVSQYDVETKLEALLKKIIIEQRQVAVLHMVHASKLGLSMPSFSFIKAMQKRYGNAILCVVDMTQMRGNDSAISDYLAENCYVLITASNFFAAPPFAGAVLIPHTEGFVASCELAGMELYVAEGLQAYFTAFDIDKRLHWLRDTLKKSFKNYGLLSRWTVGLNEMMRFYQHPEVLRSSLVNDWVQRVRMLLLEQLSMFMVEDVFCSNEHIIADNALGGVNTIIAVLLIGLDEEGRGVAFSHEQLNKVIEYLLKDLSGDLPVDVSEEELAIASYKVLLGSPVRLSDSYSVLRISLDASMINAILESDNSEDAFNATIAGDACALAKLALIIRYYGYLESVVVRKSLGTITKK